MTTISGDDNHNRIVIRNISPSTERIDVLAHGGNDHITAPSVNPTRIWCGAGNDTVIGGTASFKATGWYGDDLLDGRKSVYAELSGEEGNDYLIGGGERSFLDGGAGNDTMKGGAGHDHYLVESVGDVVLEGNFDSLDSVWASLSYTLPANIEALQLGGSGHIDGRGNAAANEIAGNFYNNRLSGLAGNDTLLGHGGRDVLTGGGGKDRLTGGDGRDTFDFNAVADTGTTSAAWDVITDFARGIDRIDLATIDANGATSGNDAFRFIGSAAFSANATGQVRYVYNAATGNGVIYASTDADRTAEMVIQVNGVPKLGAADFLL